MTLSKIPQVTEAEFLLGARSSKQFPQEALTEIAIAGKSNVGKSSVLKLLLNRRKLVRISQTPGRTREINFFKTVTKQLAPFIFADLPGYGYAKVNSKLQDEWGELITEYLSGREYLKLVVLLIDSRRGISGYEIDFLLWLQQMNNNVVVVYTKVDKIPKNKRGNLLVQYQKKLPQMPPPILFSATKNTGLQELWKSIQNHI
ncbi:MAG: ribosome biogenesis GTP-binding protein YihA/YsxC [Deltaproteobacteria bacterium]|jgi:GTP-binding protein|nr:ribosome biogenesis GTP-binding protein YihA/YsxC [Deltaproteobacteria bacterium]